MPEVALRVERLDIPLEPIVCTGDVVAYAADPAATVDLVRGGEGIHVGIGNCEASLGYQRRRLRVWIRQQFDLRPVASRAVCARR